MSHKQNLHIHTTYADGKDNPEALVLEAISRGFTSIGFSEHTYMPFSSYPYQMTVEDMANYKAFAVSAAFVFGGHLAFTMAFDRAYILPMIVGKLISGICALALAQLLYKGDQEENAQDEKSSAVL